MEYLTNLKTWCLAAVFLLCMGGFSSCSKGTEPGDVNVERASNKEYDPENSEKEDYDEMKRDSLKDEYYDHADHEHHEDNME